MIDPKIAVVFEEKGKAHPLVAEGAEYQDITTMNLFCTVLDWAQFTRFAPSPRMATLPPEAQSK